VNDRVDADAVEAERQRRIADACLSDVAPKGRLTLYRRLVQRNLNAVARRLLPRTADALDSRSPGAFDRWFARFLDRAAPRTPYLRDVPVEFVAWATAAWSSDGDVPAFASDLARHEMALFAIDCAPAPDVPPSIAEVSLDRPLVFASPRALARYEHTVHDASAIRAEVTHLFLHRDDESSVRSTLIPPARADLMALLLDGTPLGAALTATDTRDTDGVARWLAELGAAGALLGGRGD
jgi:hypothetical protein